MKKAYGLVVATVMIAFLPARGFALTVRVDPSGGAPRLVINGQAVLARMFFGSKNSAPLPVSTDAREVSFEFTPVQSEPAKATMHLRFGPSAGDVYLDDIRVTDLATAGDVVPLADFEAGRARRRVYAQRVVDSVVSPPAGGPLSQFRQWLQAT